MRPLFALLGTLAALIAGTSSEEPIRDSLYDLRSDAVKLLEGAPGVARVERLVAVRRARAGAGISA
jgi:hypothetical protein